jgi:hypothetical protein
MRARIAVLSAMLVAASFLFPSTPAVAENRHWIGVREGADGLELFDRRTGDLFVPRGANLLMLVPERDHVASGLFRPRDWNPRRVDRELARMVALGYNTVRVFIDLCEIDCISTPNGNIRESYAESIAAFLRMARARGIVVMLASNDLPVRGYNDRLPCCDPFGGYRNSLWLTRRGHDLLVEYWTEVVRALKHENAPLQVATYEIQQEQFLLSDVKPLSNDSGTVSTADGETYDMSDAAQKALMVESNTLLATRRVRAAIQHVDPGALVTMGFFAQLPGDLRMVPSRAMLESSTLDFVDLHLYPGITHGLEAQVEAIGLTDAVVKPVIMGELGALRFTNASAKPASYRLAHWQAESCVHGFAGWLVWLWATEDETVFGAREDGGDIARLLSPEERPDPCSAEEVPINAATLGTATASSSAAGHDPADAIDDLIKTHWSASNFPPQWIEVDLGAELVIREVHLSVQQSPAGNTNHRLLLAGNDHVFVLAREFEGFTAREDFLSFVPAAPVVGRFVRVETVTSPSWVAWNEIQVFV